MEKLEIRETGAYLHEKRVNPTLIAEPIPISYESSINPEIALQGLEKMCSAINSLSPNETYAYLFLKTERKEGRQHGLVFYFRTEEIK